MKKDEEKTLKKKLLEAVNNLLIENKYHLTKKVEKIVKKSIKRIAKKSGKHITLTTAQI